MSAPVLILFVGVAYVVVFGGISLLRREGLSLRFAIEALLITGLVSGYCAMTGTSVHPVLFLLVLYLLTMRVRLLVDLGTWFARSGRFSTAESVFRLAARLWPDQASALIVLVNRGTALLQAGRLDEAVGMLKSVLEKSEQGYLGVKYEAAAHYNLGVAYLRGQQEANAIIEFNAVLDTWPGSKYANHAAAALEKHSRSKVAPRDEKS